MHMQEKHSGQGLSVRLIATGQEKAAEFLRVSQLAAGSGGSPDYAEGDRVRHVKFGEGTVLEIRSGGRDYEVTVDFDSAGVRKMFAKFAKLVKIS